MNRTTQWVPQRASKWVSKWGSVACALLWATYGAADVVTQYSFEGNLHDSGLAGFFADDLTPIVIAGAGGETYEPGVIGQAVKLNVVTGSAFVLTAPSSLDLNLTADFTLEAYVKPDLQNSGEWDRFWTKWNEPTTDWHWAFRYNNNGQDFFMNGGQVFDGASGLPGNSIPLDQWSHVALVGDSAAGTIKGFLNGMEVTSAAYVAPVPGTSNMNFGNFSTGGVANGLQFTGLIDEALIHNAAVPVEYLLERASYLPGVDPPDMSVSPPPTSGLVSYYPFDGDTQDAASNFTHNVGTAADDFTPRGGDANFEPGLIGNALRIGVEAGDTTDLAAVVSPDVNLPATYTIEAWINPTELTDAWQRLVLNWRGDAESAYHFAIRNNSGFVNGVSLFHQQANGAQPNANGGTAVVGEWQHIAGVADGTHLNVYLNGELVGQTAYDGTINATLSEGLGLGDSDTAVSTIKYNGLIDDLAIWSVPLTNAQIRFQYQQGLEGRNALVPEPGSSSMFVLGLLALMGKLRRQP